MPSPFPGMNPYLENPDLWSEVHSRLIVALSDALDDQLSQKYRIAIEKRVYQTTPDDSLAIGIPDVAVVGQTVPSDPTPSSTTVIAEPMTIELPMLEEVQERYLEVREVGN
jgi:Protein of unknown function (DUF4058)